MNTDYLSLVLTDESEKSMTFLEWRKLINGTDEGSNMQIIDKEMSRLNDLAGSAICKIEWDTSSSSLVMYNAAGVPVGDPIPIIGGSIDPIEITSFTNSVGIAENGNIIYSVVLKWTTNQSPVSIKLMDVELTDPTVSGITYDDVSISSTTTFKLLVTDSLENQDTGTTTITFTDGVYHGSASADVSIDDNLLYSLTKVLQTSKKLTFTDTANTGEYLYFALPESYGTPVFYVNNFEGGFTKVSSFNYENQYGYVKPYAVWRSENSGLGSTAVTVQWSAG